MALNKESEVHKKRRGLNRAVGIMLGGFIALVFTLTIVKVTNGDFAMQPQNGAVVSDQ